MKRAIIAALPCILLFPLPAVAGSGRWGFAPHETSPDFSDQIKSLVQDFREFAISSMENDHPVGDEVILEFTDRLASSQGEIEKSAEEICKTTRMYRCEADSSARLILVCTGSGRVRGDYWSVDMNETLDAYLYLAEFEKDAETLKEVKDSQSRSYLDYIPLRKKPAARLKDIVSDLARAAREADKCVYGRYQEISSGHLDRRYAEKREQAFVGADNN